MEEEDFWESRESRSKPGRFLFFNPKTKANSWKAPENCVVRNDHRCWYYMDASSALQGPFCCDDMAAWMAAGYFQATTLAALRDPKESPPRMAEFRKMAEFPHYHRFSPSLSASEPHDPPGGAPETENDEEILLQPTLGPQAQAGPRDVQSQSRQKQTAHAEHLEGLLQSFQNLDLQPPSASVPTAGGAGSTSALNLPLPPHALEELGKVEVTLPVETDESTHISHLTAGLAVEV